MEGNPVDGGSMIIAGLPGQRGQGLFHPGSGFGLQIGLAREGTGRDIPQEGGRYFPVSNARLKYQSIDGINGIKIAGSESDEVLNVEIVTTARPGIVAQAIQNAVINRRAG